jgi:hypothetical protein
MPEQLWTPRSRDDCGDGRQSAVHDGLRSLELAAFPTSVEWHIWWKLHRHRIATGESTGWERALADGIGRLMDNQLTVSRLIRAEGEGKQMIRYNPDGQVIGEELRSPDEVTREAFVWWLNMARPALLKDGTTDLQPGVPPWAGTLATAVEGCFIQQCRLGIELTGIKAKGYLTVNASATKPLPTEKEIRDDGMAAFGKFSDRDREDV